MDVSGFVIGVILKARTSEVEIAGAIPAKFKEQITVYSGKLTVDTIFDITVSVLFLTRVQEGGEFKL